MSAASRIIGAGIAAASMVAIVAGSHVDLPAASSSDAILRLSWSARPERIERCVRVSEEELARLPVHMRRELVCEGTAARYRLEVARSGMLVDSQIVSGGGLRQDREVYVLRELRLSARSTRITVRFVRIDSSSPGVPRNEEERHAGAGRADAAEAGAGPGAQARPAAPAGRSEREAEERERRRAEAIPPVLSLDTVVALTSRSVILVTYDPILRRLVTRSGAP